jgi:MFS family permease
MFFFTMSFNLVLPEMNAVITNLDGAELKGWIIGLFTISAGLSRPFSGKLADFIGRKNVLLVGIFFSLLICLLYPFAFSVWFLLMLRFLHGFSAGFFPTGATALVTDILSDDKRGSGMGVWGTFISLGIGTGQGLSTIIVDQVGQNGLFVVAAITVLVSYGLMFAVRETLLNPVRFHWRLMHIKKDEIIEPNVAPVAIIMFLSAMCSGIIFVMSPDLSEHLDIPNKGTFFITYVLATITVRLFTGKLSDKFGRRRLLLVGMLLLTLSMLMIGLADSPAFFMAASVVFGIATGASSPTIFAWTADLSPDHRRGIGAGTMFIALEFGIFFGAIITNMLYNNNIENQFKVFSFGAIMSGITVFYLIWHIAKRPEKRTIVQ